MDILNMKFRFRMVLPRTILKISQLLLSFRQKSYSAKTRKDAKLPDGDYMLGKGTNDPSMNPNSYPMTDTYKYPSMVRIRVEGESVGTFFLEDDPADHRGILSWFSQPQNRKLNEAGSYGYLIKASVPKELIETRQQIKLLRSDLKLINHYLEVWLFMVRGLADIRLILTVIFVMKK